MLYQIVAAITSVLEIGKNVAEVGGITVKLVPFGYDDAK